jgi:hypothetical protein
MTGLRTLYHLVRADLFERARRHSTLIVIGLTVYLTYLYLPPMDTGRLGFNMGECRGVYNSAWVGATVAVLTVVLMPLPGFYLVKNAIVRDRRTGVGQIIATTPLSKGQYTLGKMLSNWICLAVMAAVAMLAAVGVQLTRGEVRYIALGGYLAPYVLITLPMMALVAAVAVLFESIAWLRGSFGNVVFFFLFLLSYWMMAALTFTALSSTLDASGSVLASIPEPTGALVIFKNMVIGGKEHIPEYAGGLDLGNPAEKHDAISTFVWDGIDWTVPLLVGRLLWVGVAMGLASAAAAFFDRFDPAHKEVRVQRKDRPARRARVDGTETLSSPTPLPAMTHLTPLTGGSQASRLNILGRIVFFELRLVLKGKRWWWYAVAGGLVLVGLLSPIGEARQVWLPLAWLWPLLMWSPLGNREGQHRTDQMVFSVAFPLRRQLPAAWTAGFVVALATGSGAAVRLVLAGQWSALLAWAVGAAFIPALALTLGVWSGSPKLFEVVYLVLWSLGPMNQILAALDLPTIMNQVVALDYVGATDDAIATGMPLCYLVFTVLLLGLAFAGRKRQLQA